MSVTGAKSLEPIYFGDSSSTLSCEPDTKLSQVTLTKFATIPNESPLSISLDFESCSSTNDDDERRRSELLLCPNNQHATSNRKWPWQMDAKSSSPTQLGLSTRSDCCPNSSAREPFQVLWRRLSFEVQDSTYDQLIKAALKRTLTPWRSIPEEFDSGAKLTTRADKRRVIFENLNGYIKSGEISAILGPSGAGKTSLLNAICGRVNNYRGTMQLLGGGKRRMRLSIIPQKDYLIENLTVRENLYYASQILNTQKDFDHRANILRVTRMLNLTNCFDACVANISGGEYKRVSIAQELIKQPDILVLDEPTSGLDSMNCKNLIKSLVQLIEASRLGALNPIAIVMTIHQPDIEVFHMFDHIYCMARRGRVVFDGKPGEVLDLVKTHAGLANIAENSVQVNPANLLIEIASEDVYGNEPIERLAAYQRKQFEIETEQEFLAKTIEASKLVAQMPKLFPTQQQQYPLAINLSEAREDDKPPAKSNDLLAIACPTTVQSHRSSGSSSPISCSTVSCSSRSVGHLVRDKRLQAKNDNTGRFWAHTKLLAGRAFTSTIRDPLMTLISFVFHLSIPFVMWTVYSRRIGTVRACPVIQREMDVVSMASNNTIGKVEEMQEDFALALECSTMFFLSTYSFSMCSLSIAALAFPMNMHILLREVRNGWYSLPSYVVAKTIANFPFEVMFPVISLVMIYLMLGMPGSFLDWRLWAIALVMALISMISHTQGLIFGALCMDSVQTSIFLATASSLPQILLSGFTARIKHMPVLLQKLSWFSLYRYSSDSINMIRFGFGLCPCDESTSEYLRTKQAVFTDVPDNLKPLLAYYLTSRNSDHLANSTLNDTSAASRQLAQIPGISSELSLSDAARSQLVAKIEANEVDIFGQMANMMARSFSYGRSITDCASVRSQLLTMADAPRDDFLPMMFVGMVGLLVAAKLILFAIVRLKVGGRI